MIGSFLRAVYPRRCPCCRGVIAPDMLICPDCRSKFKAIAPPYCLKCGRTVPDGTEYCEECRNKDHGYSAGISVFVYDSRMRRSMSDFKFHGWRENGDYYVAETLRLHSGEILDFAPDILVPVPIHRSKRAFRGYNQAELLAEGIGKALDIPVVNDLLFRAKRTRAQKTLGQENRSANLRQAFACNTEKYDEEFITRSFRKVMIVDDIYTTGSTMEACTRVLTDAGVARVGILCIAAGGGT